MDNEERAEMKANCYYAILSAILISHPRVGGHTGNVTVCDTGGFRASCCDVTGISLCPQPTQWRHTADIILRVQLLSTGMCFVTPVDVNVIIE